MSKSGFVSVGLAALCWTAHAGTLQYDVTELPAVLLSADEPNYMDGAAIDEKGRALIGVSIDSGPFFTGEFCRITKCSRIKPKQQSTYWKAFNGAGVLAGAVYDGFDPRPARRNADGSVQILGNNRGWATGVNSAGVIVGSDGLDAFYFDTERHVLPTLGGRVGNAYAITDDGVIVGESTLASGYTRAVLFHMTGEITNLGVLEGGTRSSAHAINSKGVAVGASDKAGQWDVAPVKFEGGKVIELGTLGGTWGYAEAINKAGTVVGLTSLSTGQGTHAFVYKNNKMEDLNNAISAEAQSQWELYSAHAINNGGQILANAYRRSDPVGSVVLVLTPKR